MTKEQVRKYTEIGRKAWWPLYRTYEIKALGGINVSVSAFCSYQNYSNQYKYFPKHQTEMFTHTGSRGVYNTIGCGGWI